MLLENKTCISSLFSFEVLLSFALFIAIIFNFRYKIYVYVDGFTDVGVGKYSYFMAMVVVISFIDLVVNSMMRNTGRFLWLAIVFASFACLTTAISGLYVINKLPFRFVIIFYWVSVMILSYYSVLKLKTVKYHNAIMVFMVIFIAYVYYALSFRVTNTTYTALNPVYFVAYFMPIVLFLRIKLVKIGLLLVIFICVVLSYKRMAIMAYVSSMAVYFYCLYKLNSGNKLWKNLVVFFGALVFISILFFAYKHLSMVFEIDWSSRLSSLTQDAGSGRLYIYQRVIDAFLSEPSCWLIGHGREAVFITMGEYAHNDLLEILFDYGLFGLFFYIAFIVSLIKILIEMKKYQYPHLGAYAVSLVWFAWGSMFSILLSQTDWFLCLTMFWGMTIADFQNYKAKLAEYYYENEQSGLNDSQIINDCNY